MPKGANTHTDPNAGPAAGDVSRYYYRPDGADRWFYRVGAAADGNINFGNADFGHSQLGDTYRYIIREVSATDGDVTMDGRVYYMEATVAYDQENKEFYLQKRYYSDDTYTTRLGDVNFASFVNLKGDVPRAVPKLIVQKVLEQDDNRTSIRAGQFAFEAIDSHGRVVATCGPSDGDGVASAELFLPTLTPVDFEGRAGTKTYTYTLKEIVPAGATDNGNGTFTIDGVTYKYDPNKTYTATFTATFDENNNSITVGEVTYSATPEFHNEVMPATLTVVKAWKNVDGGEDTASHANDSVWVQLYKQTRENESSAWSADVPVGEPVELNNRCSWTHTFNLPKDGTGSNVRYLAKEGTKSDGTFTPLAENGAIMAAKSSVNDAGVPYILESTTWAGDGVIDAGDGYASVPDYGSATETIANKPAQTKITVVKQWTDSATGNTHPDVWVQLYKDDDIPVGDPVKITDEPGLAHEFGGLVPEGTYTAKEGTYDGTTFRPTTLFTVEGDPVKYYTQKSVTYYDAGSEDARAEANLDGTVFPDAGRVVIVNKPLQAEITLLKVDADSAGGADPIANVTFKLLKDAGAGTVVVTGGEVITTKADGTVALPALDPGTYWLLETGVPDGYLMRDANHPIGITVSVNEGALSVSLIPDDYDTEKTRPALSDPDKDGAYTLTVKNLRTYALPSAGGPGVYPFLVIGAFAAAFAVSTALDNRKRASRRGAGER